MLCGCCQWCNEAEIIIIKAFSVENILKDPVGRPKPQNNSDFCHIKKSVLIESLKILPPGKDNLLIELSPAVHKDSIIRFGTGWTHVGDFKKRSDSN